MNTPANMPDMSKCPLHEVDTFSPEFLQQPHVFYRRLREEAPAWRDPKNNIVYLSSYKLVMKALSQPKIFSNQFGAQLRAGGADTEVDPEEAAIVAQDVDLVDTMLTADPPVHTRYKKLSGAAFTYRKVMEMNSYVTGVVNDLIDRFIKHGRCEFKSQFANLLPMYLICDALGFPRDGYETYERWSDAYVAQLGGMLDREGRLEVARLIKESHDFMLDIAEQRRGNPQQDIFSDLVAFDLELEDGSTRKLDGGEICSIAQQILVAGNETTAHTLTTGLYYLLQHPEQMQKLQENPDLVPNFVEETLRLLTPSNNMWRVASEDTEIGGVEVKAGDLLLLRFGSANRDEAQFPDGDKFDITRENAKKHLAFGAGVHLCLGQQLARKEMATAFPIVLERMKNIRLANPDQEFQFVPSILLRGVVSLDIEFDPA